jgi:hypothetical protein
MKDSHAADDFKHIYTNKFVHGIAFYFLSAPFSNKFIDEKESCDIGMRAIQLRTLGLCPLDSSSYKAGFFLQNWNFYFVRKACKYSNYSVIPKHGHIVLQLPEHSITTHSHGIHK